MRMTTPSWVYKFGARENIFEPMMTGLGRAAFKAFGLGALEIPWIGFGRIRGSKPWVAGMMGVPFWINLGDGFATTGNAKTRGVKPSMASMACPFFGAGAPKSISDSIISLITTEVGRAGGILHKCSCKNSSQSVLDPIIIALWLVPVWVFGGHRLAAMQSLLRIIFFFNLDDTTVG